MLQIRSVAANAEDSYLCMLLGSGAVHAAMAGFCGLSIGLVNNRTVLIPVSKHHTTTNVHNMRSFGPKLMDGII